MKTRNQCTNDQCKYWWYEEDQNACPECDSTVTHTKVLDFLEPGQGNVSSKRTVCYTYKNGVITGRSPDKVIEPGVVLQGVPYNGLQKKEFVVDKIKYRAHKGAMDHLFHFTVICHEEVQ